MYKYFTALTIAGSDSSGGAGIQADIKTMSAIGVYAMSAITAITAQNTLAVKSVEPISPQMVENQIDAVFSDIRPQAVKIGMLFNTDIICAVINQIEKWQPHNIVLDPVMISTSGYNLISDDAINYLITKLMPLATLITPNKFEAERIAGIKITSDYDVTRVAKIIMNMAGTNVLIKGGHFEGNMMCDSLFLYGQSDPHVFKSDKVLTINTHGTGCTLSSAIAAYLALGKPLPDAIQSAKNYLQEALTQGKNVNIGNGHGPVNHFHSPQKLVKYKI